MPAYTELHAPCGRERLRLTRAEPHRRSMRPPIETQGQAPTLPPPHRRIRPTACGRAVLPQLRVLRSRGRARSLIGAALRVCSFAPGRSRCCTARSTPLANQQSFRSVDIPGPRGTTVDIKGRPLPARAASSSSPTSTRSAAPTAAVGTRRRPAPTPAKLSRLARSRLEARDTHPAVGGPVACTCRRAAPSENGPRLA